MEILSDPGFIEDVPGSPTPGWIRNSSEIVITGSQAVFTIGAGSSGTLTPTPSVIAITNRRYRLTVDCAEITNPVAATITWGGQTFWTEADGAGITTRILTATDPFGFLITGTADTPNGFAGKFNSVSLDLLPNDITKAFAQDYAGCKGRGRRCR